MSNYLLADAPPGYYTIEAAAHRIGMTPTALRQRIARGEVAAEATRIPGNPTRTFGRWVVSRRTVRALILAHYAACLAAQTPELAERDEASA